MNFDSLLIRLWQKQTKFEISLDLVKKFPLSIHTEYLFGDSFSHIHETTLPKKL